MSLETHSQGAGLNDIDEQEADGGAGLVRTDNNMELSSWPQIAAINQKNYYTYDPILLSRTSRVRSLPFATVQQLKC